MQAIGHGRRFARADSAATRAEGLSVALTIHDAWWVPGSAESPLTPEVVTTHHQGYYGNDGNTPATGFNSPILNSQVAVQGSFRFTIEDLPVWLKLVERMLKTALPTAAPEPRPALATACLGLKPTHHEQSLSGASHFLV